MRVGGINYFWGVVLNFCTFIHLVTDGIQNWIMDKQWYSICFTECFEYGDTGKTDCDTPKTDNNQTIIYISLIYGQLSKLTLAD